MTASDGQSPIEKSSQLVLLVSKNFDENGSLLCKVIDEKFHDPKFIFPNSNLQQFEAISGQEKAVLKLKVFICSYLILLITSSFSAFIVI